MEKIDSGVIAVRLARAVKYIRENIYRELPMQTFHVFLEIAAEEGIDTRTLASRTDIQSGPLSRNTGILSSYIEVKNGEKKKRGYELIEARPDLYNRKSLSYYLTPKGKQLLFIINEYVSGETKIYEPL